MDSAPAVRISGLTKTYGAVTALHEIDFALHRGEIHALIGENGAGKSTLARVIAGLETPTTGTLEVSGRPVKNFDRRTLMSHGVGLVQQHFTLVPSYTAEENIALSRPTSRVRPSRRALAARMRELSDRFGLDVRTGIPVRDLSVGERQRVEILRALDADAEILLLDEPTAILVESEADKLLDLCRALAADGRAVMIVTHRLGEVVSAADRATVLRHGSTVLSTDQVHAYGKAELAAAMVGDSSGTISELARARPDPDRSREPVLTVESVTSGRLHDCSFAVSPGEIVGIAGVDGNGQSELEDVLSGMAAPVEGTVAFGSVNLREGRPRDRPQQGVAYVPSDRHHRALAMPLSIADNLELGRGSWWRATPRRRDDAASARLADWDVRGGDVRTRTALLSGGNAQKVVLAREITPEPSLVIACYPTRGLDPGASRGIAERIVDAVDGRGAAAVWFGAELDELLAVADRIVVLVAGKASTEFSRPFDRQAIGRAMAGVTHESA